LRANYNIDKGRFYEGPGTDVVPTVFFVWLSGFVVAAKIILIPRYIMYLIVLALLTAKAEEFITFALEPYPMLPLAAGGVWRTGVVVEEGG